MKAKRSKTSASRAQATRKLRRSKPAARKRCVTSTRTPRTPMAVAHEYTIPDEDAGPNYALDPVATQLKAQRLLEYYFSDKFVHQTYSQLSVPLNEFISIGLLANYGRLKPLRCSASILHAAASASTLLQIDETNSAVRRQKPCTSLPKTQEAMKSIHAFGLPSDLLKDAIDQYFSEFGVIESSAMISERNGGYMARYLHPESATQAVSRRHYFNGAPFSVTFANSRTRNEKLSGPLSLPTELYVPGCVIVLDNFVKDVKVPELSILKTFFNRYASVRSTMRSEMRLSHGAILVELAEPSAQQVVQALTNSAEGRTANVVADASIELNPALQDVREFISKSCVLRCATGAVEIEYQVSSLKSRLARLSAPHISTHRLSHGAPRAGAASISARRHRTRKVKLLQESIRILTSHLNRFNLPGPCPISSPVSNKPRLLKTKLSSDEPHNGSNLQDDGAINELLCGFQNVHFEM